jgi:hypothetical protein
LLAEKNGIPADRHVGRTVRETVPSIASAVETVCWELIVTGEPRLNVQMTGETGAQPGVKRTWLNSYFP